MRSPVERDHAPRVPAFMNEDDIAGVLEDVNVMPGKLPHRTQRQAKLMRIDMRIIICGLSHEAIMAG